MKAIIKEAIEAASRVGRKAAASESLTSETKQKLAQLRANGYVVFDHCVGTKAFADLQKLVASRIEDDLAFTTPCLAQKKIDQERDADLIAHNFKVSKSEMVERELVFSREQVRDYEQVIDEFGPSTLTLPMPQDPAMYSLWLDDKVRSVIEAYMGFAPILKEAYIRRNFPCTYRVMNHKWHRDTNHRKHLLKAFIFFTDCDIETGAHHYVAGSVQDERFRENRYFEDAEIDAAYPMESGKQIVSTVPAGTIILEDTRGLHKAGIPKRSYRDLGFAVFVPHNVLNRKESLYSVDANTVQALSPFQRKYIPKSSIK